MDKDQIESYIISSSATKFRALIRLLLQQWFGCTPISIDQKGDHGNDWILLKDNRSLDGLAFQDTEVGQTWAAKAKRNAKEAKETYGIHTFYFFNSRNREEGALFTLKKEIEAELQIWAECFDSKKMAELVISSDCIFDFCEIMDIPAPPSSKLIDNQISFLHSFRNFSKERWDCRKEIIEDAILYTLFGAPVSQAVLIEKARDVLQFRETREDELQSRIDYLLQQKQITSNEGVFSLTDEAIKRIGSGQSYVSQHIGSLEAGIQAILNKHGAAEIADCSQIATHATLFLLREKVSRIKDAKIGFEIDRILDWLGDPFNALRGVIARYINSTQKRGAAIDEILIFTNSNPIVIEMASKISILALDGVSPESLSKSFGIRNWRDATAIIDTTALVPYMAAKLFGLKKKEPFLSESLFSVCELQKFECNIVAINDYLEECATHLLKAREYAFIIDFEEELAHSTNGYISAYFSLKNSCRPFPPNLISYLKVFASSIDRDCSDNEHKKAIIIREIAQTLGVVGVQGISTRYFDAKEFKPIEIAFSENSRGNPSYENRDPKLIKHDVKAIAILQDLAKSGGAICITWDRLIAKTAKEFSDIQLVLSPDNLLDILSPFDKKFNESALYSLAQNLIANENRSANKKKARVLDGLVSHFSRDHQLWETHANIGKLKDGIRKVFSADDYDADYSGLVTSLYKELFQQNDAIPSVVSEF